MKTEIISPFKQARIEFEAWYMKAFNLQHMPAYIRSEEKKAAKARYESETGKKYSL